MCIRDSSYVAKELLKRGDKVVAYDFMQSNVMQQILEPEEISQITIVIGAITDLARICRVIKAVSYTHLDVYKRQGC